MRLETARLWFTDSIPANKNTFCERFANVAFNLLLAFKTWYFKCFKSFYFGYANIIGGKIAHVMETLILNDL